MSQFTKNFSSGWAQLILNVTESDISVANNTGKINWSLQIKAITQLYASSYTGISISVSIGGTSRYSATSYRLPALAVGATATIASGSFTKGHASDGSLSMAVSAAFTTPLSIGSASISGTFTGTKIARSTQPTLSSTSITLGESVTINMPRAVSTFTHRLTYSIGSMSGELGTDLGTSYTWESVPIDFANQITAAESGTVTIRCYTYNGSSLVGSYKAASLTVKVPSGIKAAVSSITTSEAVQAIASKFSLTDKFVLGLSQIAATVNVDTSAAYGATVKSYSTVIDGIEYNSAQFTSGVLVTPGVMTVKSVITDSRGRKTEYTKQIVVLDYAEPSVSIDLQTGGQNQTLGVNLSGKVYDVDGQNSKTLKLKYKKLTNETYLERIVTISDWTFNVNVLLENIDDETTYEVIAEITDKMTTTQVQTTTGIICISRHAGGKGVAFFKEADKDGVDINGNAFISGRLMINNMPIYSHIVEAVETDSWYYEKYSNGYFKAWRKGGGTSAISTSSNGVYRSEAKTQNFPDIGITGIVYVNVNIYNGMANTWANITNVTTEKITFYLVAASTVTSRAYTAFYEVVGTYAQPLK